MYKDPILIVGMHRSGTSCLAGSLEETGMFLGEVNTKSNANLKGNRENLDVMTLQNNIFSRVGSAWDDPPQKNPVWQKDEIETLENICNSYPQDKLWGFKDPRCLFLISGWEAISKPTYVGTFRHPNEVAMSLVSRAEAWGQPMELKKAYELWRQYNLKLLALHKTQTFDILRYDIDIDLYHQKLGIIANKLGLKMLKTPKFREKTLRHQRSNDEVPTGLREVWNQLNAVAL